MMEIFEYLKEKKKIYDAILEFLESESDAGLHFQNLIEILESQNIRDNKKDFKLLIQIINRISEGHFQTTSFIQRVEHILLYLRDDILQNLSNNQIFNIFKGNKRLLLFLFENQMLKHNKIITFYIMKNDNYLYYLIPEMKDILDDRYEGVLNELHRYRRGSENNYEEKRRIGQNEELGAELIRKDKLEEFINFLKEYGIPLKEYDLPCSPFDTNYLMRKRKQTSLLEYAAFFGSLRTFKYLKENKLPLTSSLWIYGVHSKSIAMIRLLEEYRVPFDDKCLEEAIRCHHNDVARYILSYLVDRKVVLANIKNNFMENVFSYAFHYHNFEFIPTKFEDKFAFYYFCYYGYFQLVEIYTRIKKVDLNSKIHVTFKIKNKEETIEKDVTPMFIAGMKNQYEIVYFLLNFPSVQIGPFEFKDCSRMKQLVIPSRIKKIGWHAFENCISLRRIYIPPSVTQIDFYAFYICKGFKEVQIPESIVEIERYTFYRCTGMLKLVLPKSVKKIGYSAFGYCISLIDLTIPDSVIEIGDYAFQYCYCLAEVRLPHSVATIGWNTFDNCRGLHRVYFENPSVQIGKRAFRECTRLEEITLPASADIEELKISPKAKITRI